MSKIAFGVWDAFGAYEVARSPVHPDIVSQHLDVDEVIAEKFELYRSIWRECGHIGPMPHTFLMRAVHVAEIEGEHNAKSLK